METKSLVSYCEDQIRKPNSIKYTEEVHNILCGYMYKQTSSIRGITDLKLIYSFMDIAMTNSKARTGYDESSKYDLVYKRICDLNGLIMSNFLYTKKTKSRINEKLQHLLKEPGGKPITLLTNMLAGLVEIPKYARADGVIDLVECINDILDLIVIEMMCEDIEEEEKSEHIEECLALVCRRWYFVYNLISITSKITESDYTRAHQRDQIFPHLRGNNPRAYNYVISRFDDYSTKESRSLIEDSIGIDNNQLGVSDQLENDDILARSVRERLEQVHISRLNVTAIASPPIHKNEKSFHELISNSGSGHMLLKEAEEGLTEIMNEYESEHNRSSSRCFNAIIETCIRYCKGLNSDDALSSSEYNADLIKSLSMALLMKKRDKDARESNSIPTSVFSSCLTKTISLLNNATRKAIDKKSLYEISKENSELSKVLAYIHRNSPIPPKTNEAITEFINSMPKKNKLIIGKCIYPASLYIPSHKEVAGFSCKEYEHLIDFDADVIESDISHVIICVADCEYPESLTKRTSLVTMRSKCKEWFGLCLGSVNTSVSAKHYIKTLGVILKITETLLLADNHSASSIVDALNTHNKLNMEHLSSMIKEVLSVADSSWKGMQLDSIIRSRAASTHKQVTEVSDLRHKIFSMHDYMLIRDFVHTQRLAEQMKEKLTMSNELEIDTMKCILLMNWLYYVETIGPREPYRTSDTETIAEREMTLRYIDTIKSIKSSLRDDAMAILTTKTGTGGLVLNTNEYSLMYDIMIKQKSPASEVIKMFNTDYIALMNMDSLNSIPLYDSQFGNMALHAYSVMFSDQEKMRNLKERLSEVTKNTNYSMNQDEFWFHDTLRISACSFLEKLLSSIEKHLDKISSGEYNVKIGKPGTTSGLLTVAVDALRRESYDHIRLQPSGSKEDKRLFVLEFGKEQFEENEEPESEELDVMKETIDPPGARDFIKAQIATSWYINDLLTRITTSKIFAFLPKATQKEIALQIRVCHEYTRQGKEFTIENIIKCIPASYDQEKIKRCILILTAIVIGNFSVYDDTNQAFLVKFDALSDKDNMYLGIKLMRESAKWIVNSMYYNVVPDPVPILSSELFSLPEIAECLLHSPGTASSIKFKNGVRDYGAMLYGNSTAHRHFLRTNPITKLFQSSIESMDRHEISASEVRDSMFKRSDIISGITKSNLEQKPDNRAPIKALNRAALDHYIYKRFENSHVTFHKDKMIYVLHDPLSLDKMYANSGDDSDNMKALHSRYMPVQYSRSIEEREYLINHQGATSGFFITLARVIEDKSLVRSHNSGLVTVDIALIKQSDDNTEDFIVKRVDVQRCCVLDPEWVASYKMPNDPL